jgi:hypothetical protein
MSKDACEYSKATPLLGLSADQHPHKLKSEQHSERCHFSTTHYRNKINLCEYVCEKDRIRAHGVHPTDLGRTPTSPF